LSSENQKQSKTMKGKRKWKTHSPTPILWAMKKRVSLLILGAATRIKGLKPPIEGETPNMCHNCGTYNRPQYDSEDTGIACKHKNRCCKSCGCSLTRAIV